MLFRVATEIGGRTVEELRDRMLAEELTEWAAYFELVAEAEKEAYSKARKDSQTESQTRSAKPRSGMGRK